MDKELVYKIFNSQNSITEWPKKKKSKHLAGRPLTNPRKIIMRRGSFFHVADNVLLYSLVHLFNKNSVRPWEHKREEHLVLLVIAGNIKGSERREWNARTTPENGQWRGAFISTNRREVESAAEANGRASTRSPAIGKVIRGGNIKAKAWRTAKVGKRKRRCGEEGGGDAVQRGDFGQMERNEQRAEKTWHIWQTK